MEFDQEILAVSKLLIQEINKEYRGIDKITDVISFALEDDETTKAPDGIRVLGDIYICIEKAREQVANVSNAFDIIKKYNDDYCTIRRDMISEGIISRENGEYSVL